MIIVNEKLKAEFRLCRCEWCKHHGPCDPAHIYPRGNSGPDARWNLCSLCRFCHSDQHSGKRPNFGDLIGIAAKRCKTLPEYITEAFHFVSRTPKDLSPERFDAALKEISAEAQRLVKSALDEAAGVPIKRKV